MTVKWINWCIICAEAYLNIHVGTYSNNHARYFILSGSGPAIIICSSCPNNQPCLLNIKFLLQKLIFQKKHHRTDNDSIYFKNAYQFTDRYNEIAMHVDHFLPAALGQLCRMII